METWILKRDNFIIRAFFELAGKWNHMDSVVPPDWSQHFCLEKLFSPPLFFNIVTKLGFEQVFFPSDLVLRAALPTSQWH